MKGLTLIGAFAGSGLFPYVLDWVPTSGALTARPSSPELG